VGQGRDRDLFRLGEEKNDRQQTRRGKKERTRAVKRKTSAYFGVWSPGEGEKKHLDCQDDGGGRADFTTSVGLSLIPVCED